MYLETYLANTGEKKRKRERAREGYMSTPAFSDQGATLREVTRARILTFMAELWPLLHVSRLSPTYAPQGYYAYENV